MAIFKCTDCCRSGSVAHCNAVFFHLIVIASGYFFLLVTWVAHCLLLVLFGLLVVAALSVLAGAGLFCAMMADQSDQLQQLLSVVLQQF
jgi:hypothetical protein